jgi:hypothetical protein
MPSTLGKRLSEIDIDPLARFERCRFERCQAPKSGTFIANVSKDMDLPILPIFPRAYPDPEKSSW